MRGGGSVLSQTKRTEEENRAGRFCASILRGGWFVYKLKLYSHASTVGSSDFDIFLEIQYASCIFGLALKS